MSIVMGSGRKDCSRLLIDIQCLLDDGEEGMKGKRFGDNLEGLLRKPCGSAWRMAMCGWCANSVLRWEQVLY